jgi:acetyl esterase/lipase
MPLICAGEKWHYAPMAVRLAQSGIMTAIVSYTLYPKAQAADMVAELGAALTWTLDNAASYGGSPSQVPIDS